MEGGATTPVSSSPPLRLVTHSRTRLRRRSLTLDPPVTPLARHTTTTTTSRHHHHHHQRQRQRHQQVRKLPKELKALAVFKAVEEVVVQFKEGIPLIALLKNEAMKPRHLKRHVCCRVVSVAVQSNS
jgi:hypothetical protein